jgi:hypothetical protein
MPSTPEPVEEVQVRLWIKRGVMRVNAYALDPDDPDHPYTQIRSQGLRPEDFGVEHPLTERFKGRSRSELISHIADLEKNALR